MLCKIRVTEVGELENRTNLLTQQKLYTVPKKKQRQREVLDSVGDLLVSGSSWKAMEVLSQTPEIICFRLIASRTEQVGLLCRHTHTPTRMQVFLSFQVLEILFHVQISCSFLLTVCYASNYIANLHAHLYFSYIF